MPAGAPHEEMGAHSRVARRFVDGVRAAQQIVVPCEGEQLCGVFAARWVQYRGIAAV